MKRFLTFLALMLVVSIVAMVGQVEAAYVASHEDCTYTYSTSITNAPNVLEAAMISHGWSSAFYLPMTATTSPDFGDTTGDILMDGTLQTYPSVVAFSHTISTPVEVLIDLGSVGIVSAVRAYYYCNWSDNPKYPLYQVVYTSVDGVNFRYFGNSCSDIGLKYPDGDAWLGFCRYGDTHLCGDTTVDWYKADWYNPGNYFWQTVDPDAEMSEARYIALQIHPARLSATPQSAITCISEIEVLLETAGGGLDKDAINALIAAALEEFEGGLDVDALIDAAIDTDPLTDGDDIDDNADAIATIIAAIDLNGDGVLSADEITDQIEDEMILAIMLALSEPGASGISSRKK